MICITSFRNGTPMIQCWGWGPRLIDRGICFERSSWIMMRGAQGWNIGVERIVDLVLKKQARLV
jgi:hypothetical protein